ncbi:MULTISPECIES: SPOR domain-containing protein [unclassified Endozoicomonas]|uniref:SPOR domain-containing protein n=1 Tax=unclassified Endozoicomonas TaxID=2644528 RepID=UPI003BB7749E
MTSRSNNSRRGASKSTNAGKSAGVSLPNWAWLLAGLVIGVFAAFLAGLTPSAKDVRSVAGQVQSSSGDEQKKDNQPVFDFYTLLPESEVTVSIAEPELKPEPVSARKPESKPDQKPAASAKKYLLQAGSFRSDKDAERLRVQLLLEGLSPKVEKVSVGTGETWHRVQLGPFADRASLHNAQEVLASKNIDSLLLQLK